MKINLSSVISTTVEGYSQFLFPYISAGPCSKDASA